MSTPSTVISFYAEAHWGSRYGVVDQYHPTPHKGLDCGLFHGTVDVPALHAGTVVAAGPSSSVGHYVTVQRADNLFDTYCHIVIGVAVGAHVVQGQRLGRQAVTQTEGGTAWRGQHTHLCLSRTRDGWATWGNWNLDPTPGVIAVLTNTAAAGSVPIRENEESMIHWGRNDAGKVTYGLGDAEHWEEYTDPARQAADAALYGVYEDITGNGAKIAAWNYRSNSRPDLKKPFGTTGVAAPNVDEAALAALLAPALAKLLPPDATKADLTAAQKAIIVALTPTYPKP